MSDTIKYGLIGAGMMGNEHLRTLMLLDDAVIVAVADPHAPSIEQSRATLGVRAADVAFAADYRDLVGQRDVDVWIIASPNFTHVQVLRDVLPKVGALLVEKPLCITLADCREVQAACARRTAPVWVGLEYRHMPPLFEFIRRLHAGEVGTLQMLSIREHRRPFLVKVGDWNRFNRNTGGTLVEKCCHFFDLMRHIVRSEPVRVFASGAQDVNHLSERYDSETPDILDNALVIVEFANGVRANLDLCMFAEGAAQQEEVVAVGDAARLDVSIPAGEVVWSPRRPHGPRRDVIAVPQVALRSGSHFGATYFQHLAMQRMLRDGGPPETSVDDGLRSVAMGLAAHRSIEERRVVMMSMMGQIKNQPIMGKKAVSSRMTEPRINPLKADRLLWLTSLLPK